MCRISISFCSLWILDWILGCRSHRALDAEGLRYSEFCLNGSHEYGSWVRENGKSSLRGYGWASMTLFQLFFAFSWKTSSEPEWVSQTPPQRQAKTFICSLSISRKPQCNFISKLLSRSRKWFNCSGINRWTWWLLTVRSPKLHLRFEDLLSCPRLLLPARARRHIDHASKVLRTPVTTVKAPIMTFTLVSAARLRRRRAARKVSN